MLTPSDIRDKELKKGLGYNRKETDVFLQEISDSYEALFKENQDLKEKINLLNDGLQYYKSIEKTLQKALVLAQKTADENQAESIKKSKEMELEARIKADLIIKEARERLNSTKEKAAELISKLEGMKLDVKSVIKAQLDLLDSPSYQFTISDIIKVDEEAETISSEEISDTEEGDLLNDEINKKEPVVYLNEENTVVEGKNEDEN